MTTTILDLIGALLLVVALGLFLGSVFGLPAGLAGGGASTLLLSWLIDYFKRKGGRK